MAQIFATEGEAGFRAREAAAIRTVAAMRGTVIATGGGAACREPNLAAMLAAGQVVALSATPAEVIRRDRNRPGPPAAARQDGSGGRGRGAARRARAVLRARPPPRRHRGPRARRGHARDRRTADRSANRRRRRSLAWRCLVISVGVELGARRYDVRIGTFDNRSGADDAADVLVAALGPSTTGVALLVDGDLAEALAARATRWWRRSRVVCRASRAATCRPARPARPWTRSPAPASGWRRRDSIGARRWSASAAAPPPITRASRRRSTCAASPSRRSRRRCWRWSTHRWAARPASTCAPARTWSVRSTSRRR